MQRWTQSFVVKVDCGQSSQWECFSSVHIGQNPPCISNWSLNWLFSCTVVYCTLYISPKKTLHTAGKIIMVQLKAILFHRWAWVSQSLCHTAGPLLEPLVTMCTCDGQEPQLSSKHSTAGSCSRCLTRPGSLSDPRAGDLHQRWCANDSLQVTVVWNVQWQN